jgi:membrane fusion protein, multidrug efflux system
MHRASLATVKCMCAAMLAAIIGVCSSGCSEPAPKKVDVVRPVKTMVVTAGNGERIRVFPATVDASKRVELAFQVPGLLAKFAAREGQKVAKGELIGPSFGRTNSRRA